MSWPALFAGVAVASGIWLLLHVLGLAIGFSQLDSGDPTSLRALGIGAGVWSVLTSMLALFCGGWVAARSAGILDRTHAVLHGAVLWGVTTLAGASLIIAALSGSDATQNPLSATSMSDVAQTVGLTTRDLLNPVNQRLEAAGKPTVTTEQLSGVLREAVDTGVRQGNMSSEVLVDAVASRTALTPKDAREVLASSQQRLTDMADRAAQATSRTFWGLFVVLTASMLAAIGGAAAGLSRRQRELSSEPADRHPHVPHPQAV